MFASERIQTVQVSLYQYSIPSIQYSIPGGGGGEKSSACILVTVVNHKTRSSIIWSSFPTFSLAHKTFQILLLKKNLDSFGRLPIAISWEAAKEHQSSYRFFITPFHFILRVEDCKAKQSKALKCLNIQSTAKTIRNIYDS